MWSLPGERHHCPFFFSLNHTHISDDLFSGWSPSRSESLLPQGASSHGWARPARSISLSLTAIRLISLHLSLSQHACDRTSGCERKCTASRGSIDEPGSLSPSLSLSPPTVEEERRQDVSSGQSCHEKTSWEKGSKQGQISDGKLPKLKVYNQGCAPLQPETQTCTHVHAHTHIQKKNKKKLSSLHQQVGFVQHNKGTKMCWGTIGRGNKKRGGFLVRSKTASTLIGSEGAKSVSEKYKRAENHQLKRV